MPAAMPQRTQSTAEHLPGSRGRPTRRASLQPANVAVHNQLCPARKDGIASDRGLTVDRKNAGAEHPLRVADSLTSDAAAFGDPRCKAGQRTVALGELQSP